MFLFPSLPTEAQNSLQTKGSDCIGGGMNEALQATVGNGENTLVAGSSPAIRTTF
jgi:hypothetical protein